MEQSNPQAVPAQTWINKAALYELLAQSFLLVTRELTEALANGEYAEALAEIGGANQLDAVVLKEAVEELAVYRGRDTDELFHELRVEYTHLFVGAPEPAVSPFAGVWWARNAGVQPLLFVNKESMAVERFMRSCGIGSREGTNEPLDHLGSELEFLQYLCLLRADAVAAPAASEPTTAVAVVEPGAAASAEPSAPAAPAVPAQAYEDFYAVHFSTWVFEFAAKTVKEARVPFYRLAARALGALPATPL
ncbi:MAG: molecular chaperone TorD family protein [Coriobacteriales bacterium]|nr:molecular chaperone TorD family protein [Coriobacteriales bacterium]